MPLPYCLFPGESQVFGGSHNHAVLCTLSPHSVIESDDRNSQLWNWNCGQKGDFPTPGLGRSVLAAANGYTLADLSGQWVYEGGWGTLELTNNQLTSVNLTGCRSLQTIKLDGNVLDGTQVDGVLAEVASWGTTGFHLDLAGTNAAPSAAGRRDAADLRDRGWQVTLAPG